MLNQSSEQPLLLVPKSHSDDTLNNNCHHNNLGQPKPGISCGNIASAVATKNKLRTLQLNSSVSTSSDNDLSPTTTDSTPTSSGNNSHGVASGGRSSPCSNLSSPVSVTDILNNNNNPASNANTSTKSTSNSTDKCNNSRALPEILENIAKTDNFLQVRHRWNTNEEIAAILIAFDKHDQWLSHEVRIRPISGSMMLYSRKQVRYRRDGYCWKKRKDGKTTREDHMKLKVQGFECIYGCYVHSAVLPTFHRRCYWLLQNPDMVMVHYLNVPYNDDNKIINPTLNFADSKKEWTKEDLIAELKPMFYTDYDQELSCELEKSSLETIETIVHKLMLRQRARVKSIDDTSTSETNANANKAKVFSGKLSAVKSNGVVESSGSVPTSSQIHFISNLCHNGSPFSPSLAANTFRIVSTTAVAPKTDMNGNSITLNSATTVSQNPSVQLMQLAKTNNLANSTCQQAENAPNTPLLLNVSQLHHSGSGFYILNSNQWPTITSASVIKSDQALPDSRVLQSPTQMDTNHSPLFEQRLSNSTGKTNTENHSSFPEFSGKENINCNSDDESMMICSDPASPQRIINENINLAQSSSFLCDDHDLMASQTAFDNCDSLFGNDSFSINNGFHQLTNSNFPSDLLFDPASTTIHYTPNLNGTSNFMNQPDFNSNFIATLPVNNNNTTRNRNSNEVNDEHDPIQSYIDHEDMSGNDHETGLFSLEAFDIFNDFEHLDTDFPNQSNVSHAIPHQTNQVNETDNNGNLDLFLHSNNYMTFVPQHTSQANDNLHVNSGYSSALCQSLLSSTFSTDSMTANGDGPRSGQCTNTLLTSKHNMENGSKCLGPTLDRKGVDNDDRIHGHHADTIKANSNAIVNGSDPGPSGGLDKNGNIPVHSSPANCDSHNNNENNANHRPYLDELFISNANSEAVSNSVIESNKVQCNQLNDEQSSSVDPFYDTLSTSHGATKPVNSNCETLSSDDDGSNNSLALITDYSPEWCYTEGGIKVLVAGPWVDANMNYTIHFDSVAVDTELVQNGLLRCFSPEHEPGFVKLQVCGNDHVISKAVLFEYRRHHSSLQNKSDKLFAVDENLCQSSLLKRCQQLYNYGFNGSCEAANLLKRRMMEKGSSQNGTELEKCIGHLFHQMVQSINFSDVDSSAFGCASEYGDKSILHVCVALNMVNVVRMLLSCELIGQVSMLADQVNPLVTDCHGSTPFMWACALGHCRCAIMLLKHNLETVHIANHYGQQPLDVARQKGHHHLIRVCLNTLNQEANNHCNQLKEYNENQVPELECDCSSETFLSGCNVCPECELNEDHPCHCDTGMAHFTQTEVTQINDPLTELVSSNEEEHESHDDSHLNEYLGTSYFSDGHYAVGQYPLQLMFAGYREASASCHSLSTSTDSSPYSSLEYAHTSFKNELVQQSSGNIMIQELNELSILGDTTRQQHSVGDHAAQVIQKAYKSFRDKKFIQNEDKQRAAFIIQNYFRKHRMHRQSSRYVLHQYDERDTSDSKPYQNPTRPSVHCEEVDSDEGIYSSETTSPASTSMTGSQESCEDRDNLFTYFKLERSANGLSNVDYCCSSKLGENKCLKLAGSVNLRAHSMSSSLEDVYSLGSRSTINNNNKRKF